MGGGDNSNRAYIPNYRHERSFHRNESRVEASNDATARTPSILPSRILSRATSIGIIVAAIVTVTVVAANRSPIAAPSHAIGPSRPIETTIRIIVPATKRSNAVCDRYTHVFEPHDRENDIRERGDVFNVPHLLHRQIYLNSCFRSQRCAHHRLNVDVELMLVLDRRRYSAYRLSKRRFP